MKLHRKSTLFNYIFLKFCHLLSSSIVRFHPPLLEKRNFPSLHLFTPLVPNKWSSFILIRFPCQYSSRHLKLRIQPLTCFHRFFEHILIRTITFYFYSSIIHSSFTILFVYNLLLLLPILLEGVLKKSDFFPLRKKGANSGYLIYTYI